MEVIETVTLDGRSLEFSTGKLAKQANGACLVRFGETVVLVTTCFAEEPRLGVDFLPLTLDYREYTYAGGRIPGGWFKREGRPTEKEILTARLIDRPLRPLFPEGYHQETQIIGTVLSADQANDPDVLAINAASAALMVSDCPFNTPVAAVRVAFADGNFIINPTHEQRAKSQLEIVVAGTEQAVVMVEAGALGVGESLILDAIDTAHAAIRDIIKVQWVLVEKTGKLKPSWVPPAPPWPEDLEASITGAFSGSLDEALQVRGKLAQGQAIQAVEESALLSIPEEERGQKEAWVKGIIRKMVKSKFREAVLVKGERLDGRAFHEIRPVTCQVGLLPRTHGSALFTRGETQALVTCTLGTSEDVQIIEALEGETQQRFMLHYNFPPFSVGEVRPMRGPSRREIGHGNLARRALAPVIPPQADFPYTLRIVSDILESNGSSSMATVCGGTLALMDAGVPIAEPVAGIAMGLVSDGQRHVVLTDIAGQEDHYGDMDFKVAGTKKGVTALQMDIKVSGLSREVLEKALEQARQARLEVLEIMSQAIAKPRPEISPYAPRIVTLYIDPDKIRDVIGPGGKTIRSICEQTGAKINIEDNGRVEIATPNLEAAQATRKIIENLTRQVQVGEVFEGTVKRIETYGAFIEILPNQDGLLHISEISHERVREVSEVLKLGDKVTVKVIGIDGQDRIKLSRKALLPAPSGSGPKRRDHREAASHRGNHPGRHHR